VVKTPRVAVVSGGAGGIGQAVVLRLVRDGFFPIILDRDEAACRQIVARLAGQGHSAEVHALDVTRRDQVQGTFGQIVSAHGRIDALVNLVGGTTYARPIQDFAPAEWREVIDLNLKSAFLCCQAVIPTMRAQRSGAIVNTSSNYGFTGDATRTAYSAAKAAVIGFTRSLALELAPHGIRVNTIVPGRTATQRVMRNYTPDEWEVKGQQIPMGRAAEPEEIAEGVAFLVSDESAYMTGQSLHVNGGMVLP
jgi:NAD(P)-dependent dehydrogenase (short-subunit alcohol dehydrogenase family)